MASRKLSNRLIKREEIKEELRLVKNSDRDYITPSGRIYALYPNNMWLPKSTFVNKHNGYVYCSIHCAEGVMTQRRVHILVALAYIPNPDNLPIVMHLDNNKTNNNVSNLKWGTVSQNTQQAVDDGLLVNDKSWDDSQSQPVNMYDSHTAKLLKEFGSCREAERETGYKLNTIINSAKYRYSHIEKDYYFRYAKDGNIDIPDCICMYDYDTDELLDVFINTSEAHNKTGISQKTISDQSVKNHKPKVKYHDVYFLRIHRSEVSNELC